MEKNTEDKESKVVLKMKEPKEKLKIRKDIEDVDDENFVELKLEVER